MKFDELKSIWEQASQQKSGHPDLQKEDILVLLKTRTRSIVEKIDLNIRIGFLILVGMIIYLFIDNFIFTPLLVKRVPESGSYVYALGILDFINYFIAFGFFVYFWVSYRKINPHSINNKNLKEALQSIVRALNIFRRLFYVALLFFLVSLAIGFIAGFITGFRMKLESLGLSLASLSFWRISLALLVGILVLGAISYGVFALINWIFNRLYGQYLHKLKATLKELEETAE
ncbi:MAG: hypothetical protein Q8859_08950 [Bacteroidota bacterium]|nr:hypothetical protein [Bacteroidota bacterium]